jgi:natural product biosynthesis luciferase-like monooxygenase protein
MKHDKNTLTSSCNNIIDEKHQQILNMNTFKIPSLSLYFFASTAHYDPTTYYDFVLNASIFADQQNFEAAWFPERHFVSFGGFSPNPAVLASAVATRTRNLRLRAGSVAAPLHHAVRIAEEWSMIDGLSQGRVGLSFASGWHETDFILAENSHNLRKDITLQRIEQVRALWAGKTIEFFDTDGKSHGVRLSPEPVTKILPIWITSAGNPETYKLAGSLGIGIMCALFNQTLRQLQRKIELYRSAWRDAGHPGRGHVVTMVHTCVSEDKKIYDQIRPVMKDYLLSFSTQEPDSIIENDVLDAAVDSYFDGPSLLGSSKKAYQVLVDLGQNDIDEVGALIDFGLPYNIILKNLPNLAHTYLQLQQFKRGIQ